MHHVFFPPSGHLVCHTLKTLDFQKYNIFNPVFRVSCCKPDVWGFFTYSTKCFAVLLLVIFTLGKIFTTMIETSLFLTFLLFSCHSSSLLVVFFHIFFELRAQLSPPTSRLNPSDVSPVSVPRRRHRVVAGPGAPLVPLGPGQKASQPVHHHPPQRYQTWQPCRSAPVASPANETIQ